MKHAATLFISAFLLMVGTLKGQIYPPLEMSADMVTASSGSTADVSVRAGQNWQNITTLNGTITFDTTVITYNSMIFWGLSNPNGATFTYQGNGVLTWTWNSLITIGPSLQAGDPVFTLRFNVIGAGGSSSPVAFTTSPTALFWANGFGWSGNNFSLTNGSVTVTCGSPTSIFSSSDSLLTTSFTDQSTGGPTTYLWDFGDGNTSTQANPTHTYASSGTYVVCLVTTNSCGADSSCSTVEICSSVNASFSQSSSVVCVGDTIDLTYNGVGGTSFSWRENLNLISTQSTAQLIPTQSGNITLSLVAADGSCSDSITANITVGQANVSAQGNPNMCLGGSTQINGIGNATTYSWDQGLGTGPTHTVSPSATTTYTVTGTDAAGCTDTASITVVVDPGPAVSAGPDATICAGDTATLTASNAPFYTWSNGGQTAQIMVAPPLSTSFIVTGTNAAGCTANDTADVTVLPLPQLMPGPGTSICEGDSTQIGLSGNAVSYTWDQGLPGGLIHTVSPTTTTTYTVTGVGANGCSDTAQITVTVNPAVIADAGTDVDICEGDSALLFGLGTGGDGNFNFLWQPGNFSGQVYQVGPGATTSFILTVTDGNGCTGTDMATVMVHDTPTALFSSTSSQLVSSFTDLSTGNIQTWQWDFGDNNTSNMQSPTHTYAANGTYTVTLTVTTNFGCVSTYTETVSVMVGRLDPFTEGLNIYPNPAQEGFWVETLDGAHIEEITLIAIDGKSVLEISGNELQRQRINTSGLSHGVYQVIMKTDRGMGLGRIVVN